MMLETTDKLTETLQNITSDIQIEANFCIRHPNYQPFALPADVVARFERNPPQLQQKYRVLLLRNFIYGIYFNASLRNSLTNTPLRVSKVYSLHHNLENNSILGIDKEFYTELDDRNCGTGYFDGDWEVLRREPDASLAVVKGGLTMYAESDKHLVPDAPIAKRGDRIAVRMPKNRLQNGFYIAISNVGQEKQQSNVDLGLGRIYFNTTSSGAIALMDAITSELNAVEIPFSFQVLCHPAAFGRYDACVLSFEKQDYLTVRQVLQVIYLQHQSHFHSEIPLFTKFLAPGLGLAEEPKQKFVAQESFGMNRCQIVANAIIETWQKYGNSADEKMEAIHDYFVRFGIDLQRPYLNPNSEDIYLPLS
ncbi:hypothetical protein NIES4101_76690 [Calothrix sp. NIES-4101]|nr:hypothetical protein NIES4101_76690 [Calothrix sp. NIES-4101]